MILHDLLPQLMPKAIEWAKEQEAFICKTGRSLNEEEIQLAERVGVSNPEKIRILVVDGIPTPDEPMLEYMCEYTGMLGPDTIGLTLFYGIFVRMGHEEDLRLIAHECSHVAQYETHESIGAFLGEYLTQILEYGYEAAPLEVDAREKTRRAFQ